MDMKTTIRVGAVAFVTMAIAVGAVDLARKDSTPQPAAPYASRQLPDMSALQAELRRCQALGEAGPRDTACLEAWAENRRRFLITATDASERAPTRPSLPENLEKRLGPAPIPPGPVAPFIATPTILPEAP